MKLIKPSYTILEQESGLEGIYKAMERAGRVCYRSENKITEDSAKPFVDRMIRSQHYAMLEHGTVYLLYSVCCYNHYDKEFISKYTRNPYSKVICMGSDDDLVKQYKDENIYSGDIWGTGVCGNTVYAITTNYRVLVENNWLDDLKYLCEPTEFHEKRICVHFICDRGVSHEFVRHRVFSFAQESTRYCNYSKGKFNNEITYILPSWCNYEEGDYGIVGNLKRKNVGNQDGVFYEFARSLLESEHRYFNLLRDGWKPEQARAVLPLALKTELVMTGFVSDWRHFFRLRTSIIAETGKPHPQASELSDPLYKEFIKRGYINEKF